MSVEIETRLEDTIDSLLRNWQGSEDWSSLEPSVRRQAVVAAVGHRILNSGDVRLLKENAAALLAETLEADAFGIAEVDSVRDGKLGFRIYQVDGAPGDRLLAETRLFPDGNRSLIAFAMSQARPVYCNALSDEHQFADRFLTRLGFQSGVVCPLANGADQFGALAVLSSESRSYDAQDVLFAQSIASLLSTTIARRQTEAELSAQRELQNRILSTVQALVLEITPSGNITSCNKACEQLTGFEQKELLGRSVWNALLIAEEVAYVQSQFDRLLAGSENVEFECFLLSKQGDRHRVSWTFTALPASSGQPELLVGTGIDVSERMRLEEELAASRSLHQQAKQSLDEAMQQAGQMVDQGQTGPFGQLAEGKFGERRRWPRRSYPYWQLIAPIVSGRPPRRQDFRLMRCHDICAGGFAFVSDAQPEENKYVVALGAAPSLTYIAAEVAHVTKVDEEGQRYYIVGCRYLKRVELYD